MNQMILINYCTDILAIYADILASLFFFFFNFFISLHFLCWICVGYIADTE